MGWTIEVLGFDSRRGLGIFPSTTVSRTALGPTQPPIQWVPGALSLGVKRPGREADHSPSFSAEVKTEWSYTSTPQYAFMVWCSVKAQGQLYLSPFFLLLMRCFKSFLILLGTDPLFSNFSSNSLNLVRSFPVKDEVSNLYVKKRLTKDIDTK
jgi:hypothetical protein